ncbi:MAG: cytochrome c [Nitrospirales bacterium]|nr:cytochrome c [Nitrospira sp.]MDR4502507.1 cytochrome c [Nitrospirales bacterium]
MNFSQRMCLLVVILMVSGFLSPASAKAQEAGKSGEHSGDPTAGAAIFQEKCTGCHGEQGKGDGPDGMYLDPSPADLTSEDVRTDPDSELVTIIREGKAGSGMPPWEKVLTMQQIHDVLAYIRTLSR